MTACQTSAEDAPASAEDASAMDVGSTDSTGTDGTSTDSTGTDTALADTQLDASAVDTSVDTGKEPSADGATDVGIDAPSDAAESAIDTATGDVIGTDASSSDSTAGDAGTDVGISEDGGDGGTCRATDALCFRSHECCSGLGCRLDTIGATCSASCGAGGATCATSSPCCSGSICNAGICDDGPFPPPTSDRPSTAPTGTISGGLGTGTGSRPFGSPADYDLCSSAGDCADALTMRDCVSVGTAPFGVCSKRCTSDLGCTRGACVAFGTQGFCLEKCSGPSGCQSKTACKNMATKTGGTASVCSLW